MSKRSDFAQKLLDDLRLRKERVGASKSSNRSNAMAIGKYLLSICIGIIYTHKLCQSKFRHINCYTQAKCMNKTFQDTKINIAYAYIIALKKE